jgi:hypothetical protein
MWKSQFSNRNVEITVFKSHFVNRNVENATKRQRISRKNSAKWQHLSWLKASAFISLQKN